MNENRDEMIRGTERQDDGLSIPDAAAQLGIDAFSLYALVQQGKANPGRSSTGRLFLPKSEMEKLLRGSTEKS
jgi:predicted site-specific integrase-resolvase